MPVQLKDVDDRVTMLAGRMDVLVAERYAQTRRICSVEIVLDEHRWDLRRMGALINCGFWGRLKWLAVGR